MIGFDVTRRIIQGAWKGAQPFDPWLFRRQLAEFRGTRYGFDIEKLAETSTEALYIVDEDWLVFLDLAGPDAHYCTCPAGAQKVELSILGGSLCEHVLACLFRDGKAHLLTVHLHLLAKTASASSRNRP
ncbi:MAG: hypothetical protein A2V88_04915 [Elusimicrobia bacterium RBG_16_66_12]|nr:MAG: hypothetical protein A2V88_04915 [Elusimicrobia bacterium RBG_16_66_12]